MKKSVEFQCMICGCKCEFVKEFPARNCVRYLPIYYSGSEGLMICYNCEMRAIQFLKELSREHTRKKINLMREKKLCEKEFEQKS